MSASETSRASSVPPIFGRSDAVAEIDRTLEHAASGKGEGLLLSGDDGSGKSHFLRSAVVRARHRRFTVLEGRALPEDIPQPFSLVRDLVRAVAPPARADPAATDPSSALPTFLAPFSGRPDAADAPLSDRGVTTLEPEAHGTPRTPFDVPGEWIGTSREELYGNLTRYLLDLAGEGPLLLAIDDLHFADRFVDRVPRSIGAEDRRPADSDRRDRRGREPDPGPSPRDARIARAVDDDAHRATAPPLLGRGRGIRELDPARSPARPGGRPAMARADRGESPVRRAARPILHRGGRPALAALR